MKNSYLSIDIGAGSGTKVALFRGTECFIQENLPVRSYGSAYDDYFAALYNLIESLVSKDDRVPAGCGIAAAGIIDRDRTFKSVANIPVLNGHNLCDDLQQKLEIPAEVINDADAGALAEWNVLKTELLYWVLGGGWGGAWISDTGDLLFDSRGWDGKDESLHYTNEPGYSIPLEKNVIHNRFKSLGLSLTAYLSKWEEIFKTKIPEGPSGRDDALKAETLISGNGRYVLFLTARDSIYYADVKGVSPEVEKLLLNPSRAGSAINFLSKCGNTAARVTDFLFGKILGYAGLKVFSSMSGQYNPVPVCLGGMPSLGLPYFGPAAQLYLSRHGCNHYLRPSVYLERGGNANLIGAAVLAEQITRAL
jgi:hypothetical protein